MDLEKNIIDNVLECEVKLGHANIPISLFYPKSSLLELLNCTEDELRMTIMDFQKMEKGRLGKVDINELQNEKGRFEVKVSVEGVNWIRTNFEASEFIKEFIIEIKRPGATLDKMVEFFRSFSQEINIIKNKSDEWAMSFKDEKIDPYIYHIEQNLFGLEYHRFTKRAYEQTILKK